MESYNHLVKRAVGHMLTNKDDNDISEDVAFNAVQGRINSRNRLGARPPGFEGHKFRHVKVVNDACGGAKIDCRYAFLNPVRCVFTP